MRMNSPRLLSVCLMALAAVASGCGVSTYQPGRAANFQLDAAREINDEDIRKAYEASPQMSSRMGVAFYSFDPDKVPEIQAMLEATPHVEQVYNVPEFLMSGRGRYDTPNPYRAAPTPPSLKKMRMLAARAHCDVLLIFDYGYDVTVDPNGLTALNVLLLPVFFTPFLDQKVESHLDAYVIDVRNGYLYGQIMGNQKSGWEGVTIWSERGDEMAASQWPELLAETSIGLKTLIESEIAATPTVATPVATVDDEEAESP